jgi:hypothetical protein
MYSSRPHPGEFEFTLWRLLHGLAWGDIRSEYILPPDTPEQRREQVGKSPRQNRAQLDVDMHLIYRPTSHEYQCLQLQGKYIL